NNSGAVDLTLFEQGTQLPGIYPVDIFLNGKKVDYAELVFHIARDPAGQPYLRTCLVRERLLRYGVKVEDYPALFSDSDGDAPQDSSGCANLSVIPDATETFQFSEQKLLLTIPQIALRPQWRGLAPEALWDDGIPALLLNYQTSVSRTRYSNLASTDAFWGSLEPGINIGPWRLRNMTTWQKQSDRTGKWNTVYTRAERGLNALKSRLTFGEFYTPSDIFDSISLRGAQLGTDDNMVPYNQRTFAPIISGIARTQARIEVYQNNRLIYTSTVAPGAFALSNLPVTGSGGDLQVTVQETDGNTQVFTVPFTTPAISLRQGYLKYSISGGEYRSSRSGVDPAIVGQASIMYGLPQNLTVYAGTQGAEYYQSGSLGLGWSMGIPGALSVDGTWTRGQQKGQDTVQGNTWRIRYSKSYPRAGTSFTAASYQYNSDGYHTLADVLDTYHHDSISHTTTQNNRRRRSTLTLNQSLGKWGSLSLNGSRDEYRSDLPHRDAWGATYSNSWNDISISASWAENNVIRYNRQGTSRRENSFSLWVNIPLRRWLGGSDNNVYATGRIQTRTGQSTRYETGLNGRAFDRQLYWDIRQQLAPGASSTGDSSNMNLIWDGTYGELTGAYSYNKNVRQMSAGASGGMVAYSNGVIFSQRLENTTALIEAPGAYGVSVGSWPGVKTDFRGYTTLGSLAPNNENVISLNPTTLPEDVELPQTDMRVVPTKGAVVIARFNPRVGGRALLRMTQDDGKPVPFGAVVSLQGVTGENNNTGVVG
ncbi:fimbria/pilus outer membrane usher protein, partial [Escherichia coli]